MVTTEIISTDRTRAIVGMGVTGRSVARHLKKKGARFSLFDTRMEPQGLDEFRAEHPDVELHLGPLSADSFYGVDEVILSPGLSSNEGIFPTLRNRGVNIVGDIELFARAVDKPVVAITGSNAKSTVTTLVGEMAQEAGLRVGIGGNIGVPVLDLVDTESELYVLELSSFQLETTNQFQASVACILNLSQDHMDRYDGMLSYHRAKQRIYVGAEHVVCNRADALTMPLLEEGQYVSTFGLDTPDLNQFGLIKKFGESWLSCGVDQLIEVDDVALKGRHNLANALAALAIGTAAKLPIEAMLNVLRRFSGLPHRCETVLESGGVTWIDDSKATNVGAVVAALEGLSKHRNIVLIAGGQAKGQEFCLLAESILKHVKQLVLIGEDAVQIAQAVEKVGSVPTIYAVNIESAVRSAAGAANKGDVVLLSPACASFDMFESYAARGDLFAETARRIH